MKQLTFFGVLVVILFVVALNAEPQQRRQGGSMSDVQYIAASNPNMPFSDAVRVGNTLYLSGKLGTDSSGRLATGGIAAETKQTMENIKAALERNGSSLDNVVKVTVMLADMKEWGAMNAVYVTFFQKGRLPARSAFGASGLALGGRVEIECIATVK